MKIKIYKIINALIKKQRASNETSTRNSVLAVSVVHAYSSFKVDFFVVLFTPAMTRDLWNDLCVLTSVFHVRM